MFKYLLEKKGFLKAQTIILILLSAFYAFSILYYERGFADIFIKTIVVILVLLAVWSLFLNKSHSNFASYFVLLLLGYVNGASGFINWLLSYSAEFGFIGNFPKMNFMLLLGSIYLAYMTVMYFLEEGFTFHKECFNLTQLLILFPILMFLTYGINALIAVLVIEFVACNYRPIASHFLMLSKSIVFPFGFIRVLYNNGFSMTTFGQWIITALAVYIIYLLIIDFFVEYKKHKTEVCVACEV